MLNLLVWIGSIFRCTIIARIKHEGFQSLMDYLQMTAKISFFIHHFSVCSTFMCGLDQFSDSSIFAHIRSEGIQSIMDYHHIKFTGKISFFIHFFSLFAKPSCVDWIHFQNHQFLHASGMKAFKAPWIT